MIVERATARVEEGAPNPGAARPASRPESTLAVNDGLLVEEGSPCLVCTAKGLVLVLEPYQGAPPDAGGRAIGVDSGSGWRRRRSPPRRLRFSREERYELNIALSIL